MGWVSCLLLPYLSFMGCFVGTARASRPAEVGHREAQVPITTTSPPEGNATFVGGTTWCVALPGVPPSDLQLGLDWACGPGSADCNPVQPGRDCFQPDNILSHASYAFNSFYQQNGNSDIACNFGGIATITTRNPSYGSCRYPASEEPSGSISVVCLQWKLVVINVLLLLYF